MTISLEFISALCDVADNADQLVNLVLDGKPYAEVMRQLILDLNSLDNLSIGSVEQMGADLMERDFDRAELRDGAIWISEKEEESCPVKR